MFGQRSRIGLVVEWPVAKELQFVEDEVGGRWSVRLFDVVMIGHGMRSSCWIGRAHRGLRGDHSDGGRNGPAPGAARRAGAPAEDGWGAAILLREAKAREGRRKIAAPQPLPARAACRPIAL